ncbi:MAG TPA: pantoate--beta-alanine ligase [Firmicutes bacterium]|nr:pantoate--beta-alanine ligase [Bacillota bacterium]
MDYLQDLVTLRGKISTVRKQGNSIGFVPTMGFLHEGHLSLIRAARAQNDFVVVSIFVNPLQFGKGEDYAEYPRDLENDSRLAAAAGCDLIFSPAVRDFYPPGYATHVEALGSITQGLCGASRPGHFRGVTTVLVKLFNLVTPDRTYFGQKDAQQCLVVKKMLDDLNFNIQFKIMPTVREADGLAMSSRNKFLTPRQRAAAPVLYQSLRQVEALFRGGERNGAVLKDKVHRLITAVPETEIDYIEIVGVDGLKPAEQVEKSCLVALAVKFGSTRLIDNIILEV